MTDTIGLNRSLIEASKAVDEAHLHLDSAIRTWAEAEHAWKRRRAESWVRRAGDKATVAEKEAFVELETGDERYAAQLAEAVKVAAIELVRSRRGQLSAIQSMVGLSKAEAELARYASREVGP